MSGRDPEWSAQTGPDAAIPDTPLLAAKRAAFDSPTQANLDALIARVRAEERERIAEASKTDAILAIQALRDALTSAERPT